MLRFWLCLTFAQCNTKHDVMAAYALRTREPATTMFS